MPIYTGDKLGFGVAPASGSGGSGGGEVGYSTSFDNISHAKRTEHIWVVPKTARYNFEVWGADGGPGLAINGDNNNGGVPRYGRGGKVEASLLLDAGTEIGICIGDNGLFAFAYTGSNSGSFKNDGEGGWGGFQTVSGKMSFADGGNSNYNTRQYGGAHSSQSGYSYQRNYRGGGGGGGTIVRVVTSNENISYATDAQFLIVAGGGGGAGARGNDHGNSNNQGGSGGNANDKMNETQWGRRGYFAGDTSYGWPSGNASQAGSGNGSKGGDGGNGYYAGGGGGGGGIGGGGAGATCSYCGSSGGSGGTQGSQGSKGSGYDQSTGGGATSDGSCTVVGPGGNNEPNSNGYGGGGGGGYRGGGAGYWGNGQGHAGAGGGGGGSSWVTSLSAYDPKGLNGIATSPRYTSEQKPLRLGNPGGGRVFIWEANKDPLGKNRPAAMTAQKIQYASRSTNGSLPTNPLYYLGSAGNGSGNDGGYPHYGAYNNMPYDISGNKCDAIVMNVSGSGQWELHSVTVGQAQGYDYPMPYRHQAWVHVIEGTETGGVGIHTEKFDLNNPTGNPGVAGWYGHMRAGAKQQNTDDGYQELFFEKPVVMNQGEDYTIAVDWSCGGTVNNNSGGVACMNNGARTTQTLSGSNTGTVTWSDVTAYNGPHGLGTKNQDNGMETDSQQGQLVNFGIKSYDPPGGGGGSGGGSIRLDGSSVIKCGNNNSNWNIGPSEAFCVEAFVKLDNVASDYQNVFSTWQGNNSYNGWMLHIDTNGNLFWAFAGSTYGTSGGAFNADNTWFHVAVTRNAGSSMKFFIGGNEMGNASNSSAANGGTPLYLGANMDSGGSGAYRPTGYFSNYRVTIGQQVYNANFTPPTSALTLTSQGISDPDYVKLLAGQSGTDWTVTSNGPSVADVTLTAQAGTPTVNSDTPFT